MKKHNKIIAGTVLVVALVFAIFIFTSGSNAKTGKYDEFAKCVSDSGAVMYGAYWCGHCKNQKESFGDSWRLISYIECDPRGNNANPSKCESNQIRGYPTWKFSDGTTNEGAMPLSTLAQKTNCKLP